MPSTDKPHPIAEHSEEISPLSPSFQAPHPREAVLQIRIRITVLGSRSVSYSNEQNKI